MTYKYHIPAEEEQITAALTKQHEDKNKRHREGEEKKQKKEATQRWQEVKQEIVPKVSNKAKLPSAGKFA